MRNKAIAVSVAVVALLTACDEEGGIRPRADAEAGRSERETRERKQPGSRSNETEKKRRPKRERVRRVAPPRRERPSPRGTRAYVSRVIDGDTIEVDLRGTETGVRLIGFDTPETVHPSKPVECFGKAASAYTNGALTGRTVSLEFDVERTDRYGRTLAYVWIGQRLFNEEILRDGFAQVSTYPPNVKYVERFLGAQRAARNSGRGLWSRCSGDGMSSPAGGGADRASKTVLGAKNCDPNYSGACVPSYPPDIDCSDISDVDFRSKGSDPHGFDVDRDGRACES